MHLNISLLYYFSQRSRIMKSKNNTIEKPIFHENRLNHSKRHWYFPIFTSNHWSIQIHNPNFIPSLLEHFKTQTEDLAEKCYRIFV